MKQTLYQILGVDPKATPEEIEAAFKKRLEELAVATIHDPNRLVALQQSREILSDPNRRAAYDGSIAARSAPAARVAVAQAPEPGSSLPWGKAVALAIVLAAVIWWMQRSDEPPPRQSASPQQPAQTRAPAAQDEPEPAAPSDAAPAPPAEPVAVTDGATVPEAAPTAQAPPNPLAGRWQCVDAITGRSSSYEFRPDGELLITSSGAPPLTSRYEIDGKTLKIGNAAQSSTLAIEELGGKKAIFNAGAGGKRVVCTR